MRPDILRLAIVIVACTLSPVGFAQDPAFRENFDRSFLASCEKSSEDRIARDYAALAGVPVGKLADNTRSRIHSIAAPVTAISCLCLRDKVKTTFEDKSQTEAQVSVDMSALSQSTECKPSAEATASVGQQLQRLLLSAPPVFESLKSKRSPFTVSGSTRGRLSVFASSQPPPANLPRLVFLAPGTGSACPPRDLCTEKDALEVNKAPIVLTKFARVLGQEGGAALKRVIGQFGEDAQIITSSHNFTNFQPSPTPGQFSYAIANIDGQPVERSKISRLWLVIFNSPSFANPRALEFTPAFTSVLEIELSDAGQN